jgi:alkaline phosphatase
MTMFRVSSGRRAPAAIAVLFALALALSAACGGDEEAPPDPRADLSQARSVILLIGDGMGTAHRTAARLYSLGREGQLAMDTLPIAGMSRTWSTESLVPDSAAAGTALATGVKTYNAAIAVDPDGNPVETILEMAQKAGKAVGLVTTVQIAHATPAVFAAHNPDRDAYVEIALDMFDHDVDVLLGGGENHFLPVGTPGCYPRDGERTDGRNLIDEAVAKGYQHVCTEAEFDAVDPATTDRLLGTFAEGGMIRPFAPSLAEMTDKAIAILSKDPEGFFLMVEGGQIDWAAHANDALNTIGDTVGFDDAVMAALEFQIEHPDTLVIVTADHSTGGLTIEDVPQDEECTEPNADDPRECKTAFHEDGPFEESEGGTFWLDWTSGEHTGDEVPVTAIGPHAIDLAGYYENTHIFDVMSEALGLAGAE